MQSNIEIVSTLWEFRALKILLHDYWVALILKQTFNVTDFLMAKKNRNERARMERVDGFEIYVARHMWSENVGPFWSRKKFLLNVKTTLLLAVSCEGLSRRRGAEIVILSGLKGIVAEG